MSKELPPIESNATCLRCRSCSLLPQTDMSQARPIIHCGKLGQAREIVLSACWAARDDKPTLYASPVEWAYLDARYPADEPRHIIAERTGRSMDSIGTRAWQRGLRRTRRDSEAMSRRNIATRIQRGQIINEEQKAWVLSVYRSPWWPLPGGQLGTAYYLEQEDKRQRILQELARRGYGRKTFEELRKYASDQVALYRRKRLALPAPLTEPLPPFVPDLEDGAPLLPPQEPSMARFGKRSPERCAAQAAGQRARWERHRAEKAQAVQSDG